MDPILRIARRIGRPLNLDVHHEGFDQVHLRVAFNRYSQGSHCGLLLHPVDDPGKGKGPGTGKDPGSHNLIGHPDHDGCGHEDRNRDHDGRDGRDHDDRDWRGHGTETETGETIETYDWRGRGDRGGYAGGGFGVGYISGLAGGGGMDTAVPKNDTGSRHRRGRPGRNSNGCRVTAC